MRRKSHATDLSMAMQTPSQALEATWVLGYCFGIFDALAQRAGLDDGAEGFSLITFGFLGLFADPADPEAAAFVRRSLDSQDNPRFQEGAAAGGNDVFVWVANRAKVPTRCSNISPDDQEERLVAPACR